MKEAAFKAKAKWSKMVSLYGQHHLRALTAEAEALPLIEKYLSSVYWEAHDAALAAGEAEDDAEWMACNASTKAYNELEALA